MTNEQVIINKIDVSECEHLTETRHCKAQMAVIGTDANKCKCFPNCHYKQLIREKQECEKLKKQYNCYACDTCNGKEDYIQLKKHCEDAIKSLHTKQAEINQLKADNKKLKEELSKVYEDIKISPLCYKCDEDVAITLGERDKDFPEGSFAAWYGEDLSGQTYEGSLNCSNKNLTSLFGCPSVVTGYFDCRLNKLTSLEGSPKEVGGSFYCNNNKLTSLEGSPKEVGKSFYCPYNQLTSLEGSPKEVEGNFECSVNKLTSLKGAPKEVGGFFNCSDNRLTSLEGAPKEVGEDFNCSNNPDLESLEGLGEVKGEIYSNLD